MTVSQAVMSNGSWSVQLIDDTPVSVTDRLRDPFTFVKVYPTHLPAVNVAGTTPLYTGLWLRSSTRTSCEGAGPCILLGGSGSPSNTPGMLSQGSAWGPPVNNPPSPGSLAQYAAACAGNCGITAGYVGPSGTNHLSFFNHTSARDWLDNWIVPQWGVEYRVGPGLALDVGTVAQLYGTTAKAVVVPDGGGPDPGAIPGLTATKLDAELDLTDYRNRVVMDWGDGTNGGRVDTGWAPSPYYLPGGNALTWAEYGDGQPSAAAAAAQSAWLRAAHSGSTRALDVEVTDPDLTGLAPTLIGSYVDVYDPRRNLYDLGNALTYRGTVIYPIKVRCLGATWPIRAGMGVYLDNSGNVDGQITDLTDYMVFEDPSLTLTIGALPVGVTGRRRTIQT